MRPATCFMALICAAEPTRETEMPTEMAGRIALVEQVRFQEDLAVGDGNDVGGNVGRNVAGLRFDDGQRRQRAVAVFLAQPRGALQQPAVQVEHVARIRLAAGRALQHQRHLPVSHGVFGQIIVDDQRVHAVVHEPFAHGRAGERRQILVGGRVGGRGHHDDGVGHRAVLLQVAITRAMFDCFWPDGHVDRIERAIFLVARLPPPAC